MGWEQILGLVAGTMIGVSFIPQTWRLFKLKSAKEISLNFTILMFLGSILWLIYGILLSLTAVVVTNIVNSVLVMLMLFAKVKYGR